MTGDAQSIERRLHELEALVASLQAEIARLRAALGEAPAVEELERRIEALTQDIETLRLGEAAAPRAEQPVQGFGPAASKVYGLRRGVSIGGYGELLYQNFDSRRDDGAPATKDDTADLLRAVLYFGYKFNDRFLFNSEVEFEHAVSGEDAEGEVAVEFAYLDFKATSSFGVRGGLLLIPTGFLNELHEPPIFHGSRRPDVERYIIPATWRENGLGVYGDAGPLTYKVYLVNSLDALGFSPSNGVRGARQNGSEAMAGDLAVAARVDLTPVPGLVLGASAFSGGTGQERAGLPRARYTLWDAHAEWNWRGLHVRGLYAKSMLSDAEAVGAAIDALMMPAPAVPTVIGERQVGWYGELAYNVLAPRRGTGQDLSPFVRYEELDTQDGVAPGQTADPANRRIVRTYGITYRPIPNIAIKLDFQDRSNGAGTAVDQVNFALGYLF